MPLPLSLAALTLGTEPGSASRGTTGQDRTGQPQKKRCHRLLALSAQKIQQTHSKGKPTLCRFAETRFYPGQNKSEDYCHPRKRTSNGNSTRSKRRRGVRFTRFVGDDLPLIRSEVSYSRRHFFALASALALLFHPNGVQHATCMQGYAHI